jgi:hypothetical protein
MRNLRIARTVWAWLSGLIEDPGLDPWDELVAVCLLDGRPVPLRGRERRDGGVRREPVAGVAVTASEPDRRDKPSASPS